MKMKYKKVSYKSGNSFIYTLLMGSLIFSIVKRVVPIFIAILLVGGLK